LIGNALPGHLTSVLECGVKHRFRNPPTDPALSFRRNRRGQGSASRSTDLVEVSGSPP